MTLPIQSRLSEQVRSIVRDMIIGGDLSPDSRVNEVHLANELRVSRTPLREALTALAGEGALVSVPHRGFFVKPLSVEEFQAIYPIRAILDPEALLLSGVPSRDRIKRLRKLNGEIRREKDVEERVRLDDEWHLELVADCPNPVLLDLIRQFMMRTRRYELAYLRDEANVKASMHHHNRILDALDRADLQEASNCLKENMTAGIAPILDWLERRERERVRKEGKETRR